MSAENKTQKKLFKVINESLELLKQASIKNQKPAVIDIPMTSLLDQCIELCEQHHAQTKEPVRIVHYFGLPSDSALLSSLATLANTQVLTDIHPANNSFKDSIKSQRVSAKSINAYYRDTENMAEEDEYRIKVFLNDLQQTLEHCKTIGQRLLICDNHCLSQTQGKYSSDLLSLLKRQFTVQSVIVHTEPEESYLVYCAQVSAQYIPLGFDEFQQSIQDFFFINADLPVIRYEDFVTEPEKVMRDICKDLDLPFSENFLLLRAAFDK